MRLLLVCLALAAAPAAAAGPSASDERSRLRAEYETELARLRIEHQRKVAEIRAEARLLEDRVQVLRRVVPPQFDGAMVEGRLRDLAGASDIPDLEITRVAGSERIRLADGGPTPYERVSVEVAGQADYTSAGYFFDRLARLSLIVELETLSLEAASRGAVRFHGRLGFPVYSGWPEEPRPSATPAPPPLAPPSDERAAFRQALFEQRALLQRMTEEARAPIRRLQAEILAMAEMKSARAPTRFHAALARIEGLLDGQELALSRARFGARTVIEGVAVGAPARAGLRPAFEKAGFVVDGLELAAAGDCRAFSVTARLAPREEGAEQDAGPVEVGSGRFRADASRCGGAPQPFKGNVTARGSGGPVTMRVRDVDLSDVFLLLASITDASFVVDAGVKGRVNVDLEQATIEEALAALKMGGIQVGPGPLRRVSPAGTPQAPPLRSASREAPVSLSFNDAELLDVLRLFEHISARPLLTAPVADGSVTVYASEVPWDTALEAIAASAGMSAVIEDRRVFVGPAAMAKSPWTSGAVEAARAKTTDSVSRWGRVLSLPRLGADDLTPVGFARRASGIDAVAYGPGRRLWLLPAGTSLFDAQVETVDASGLTLASTDGRKTALRFP